MVFHIFKGKGDIRNCSCCRAVKLLEHGIKVEKMIEKRLHRIVSVDEMQFGFLLVRGAFAAVFILERMQAEYHAKWKKLYMCFVTSLLTEYQYIGIEVERNSRSFGWSCDNFVWGSKDMD